MRTAYDMKEPSYRSELTEVGRGTPMGELLRRYWHPVGPSSYAGETPREVRLLGEDLVLFRDGEGRAGLVHSRCCHRGTSLYYGKVEDRGLRCCYHGWLFNVEGQCLEQPCEPADSTLKDRVRQPWYPVQELYGLIFAYMGPADKMPVLPRYTCLEELAEDEFLYVDDTSVGSGGDTIVPCNWLQHWENVVDPYHVPVLHGSFTGTQFTKVMDMMPAVVEFSTNERGVQVRSERHLEGGQIMERITEAALPTLRVVGNPLAGRIDQETDMLGWTVPIDDTHYRIFTVARITEKHGFLTDKDGKKYYNPWRTLTPEQRRDRPGDWEAQVGQGAITLHSEEHLGSSDQGIVLLRRLLYKQIAVVEKGEDPINVSFDPDAPPVRFAAGAWLRKPATEAA